MFKNVKLINENGNEVNVPMKSNAGTAIRYKGTFHEEIPLTGDKNMLYVSIMASEKVDIAKEEDLSKVADIMNKASERIKRLAFIMAMSAAGKKMDQLSFDQYVEWSETLDASSFNDEKQDEIWALYTGTDSSSESKKKSEELAETLTSLSSI